MSNRSAILDALRSAEHELISLSGLTATDRPDLPISQHSAWVVDPAATLKKVQAAISLLCDSGSEV